MLSVLFLSAALQATGVARAVADRIGRVVGPREVPLIITIMLVAAALSAFMNNIAAVAVLMPAVMSLGRRTGTCVVRNQGFRIYRAYVCQSTPPGPKPQRAGPAQRCNPLVEIHLREF